MKLGKIIFLSSIFIFLALLSNAHPFYVSICQVNYNGQNQSLEISLKIFTDDLIKGLENMGGQDLNLGEENENIQTDGFIGNYLNSNPKLQISGKQLEVFYLGKEIENDVVWCFLEVTKVPDFQELEVENKILTEIFDTQSNIVNVTKNGKTKSLLLNERKPSGMVEF